MNEEETMNVRLIKERASDLINTSVQDMQSGLWNYTTKEDLAVLRIAYIIARRRNEKTKSRILASKIRKLQMELQITRVEDQRANKELNHE